MVPRPVTERNSQPQRHGDRITAEARPHASWGPVVTALRQAVGAIGPGLACVGGLTYDSREGLMSKEQHLARYGVRWATHPADDVELARELAAARRHRLAGVSVVVPAIPLPTPAGVGKLRWSAAMLLIRAGHRLQGRQSVRSAV